MLAYIWAGLTEAAAIAAIAVNKLPNTAVTLREGARALDRALDEMATRVRDAALGAFRHVILPQLAPYLAAAARSGLSLVWKIVLVVELLGRPNGVGFEIGIAFQLFDVDSSPRLFADLHRSRARRSKLPWCSPLNPTLSRWRLRPA